MPLLKLFEKFDRKKIKFCIEEEYRILYELQERSGKYGIEVMEYSATLPFEIENEGEESAAYLK